MTYYSLLLRKDCAGVFKLLIYEIPSCDFSPTTSPEDTALFL